MDPTLALSKASGPPTFAPFGGKPGTILPIVSLAIVAGIICAACAMFVFANGLNWTSGPFTAAANHLFLIVLAIAAIARPREGLLLSLILLTVNLGAPIPHGISSAPSIYLVAGSTLGFGLRMAAEGRLKISSRPAWAAALLVGSALAGLATPLISGTAAEFKFVLAQLAGISSMALYLIAPALALENKLGINWMAGAVAAATLPLAAGGVAGGAETMTCFSTGANYTPFASAGFRSSGFLPDPNIFGIVAAASVALFCNFASRRFASAWAAPAALLFCCTMVVMSGSRSGMHCLLLSVGLTATYCYFRLPRRLFVSAMAPGLAASLAVIFLAPTIWSDLPCPGLRSGSQTTFAERNDAEAYFTRVLPHDPQAARAIAAQEGLSFENMAFKRNPTLDKVFSQLPIDRARQLIWQHALIVGLAHPLFGSGLAGLSAVTPRGWSAHNTLLTTFADQGLVGLSLLLAAAALCYIPAAIALRRGNQQPDDLAPLLIAGFTLMIGSLAHDMLRLDLFWGISGVVLAAGIRAGDHATAHRVTHSLPERK